MEAAKGSIQSDSNGVQECQGSGKLNWSCKKYIGVKKCESGRFNAMITDPITKKRRGLGTYDTAEQAAAAYDFAAEMMRGTKARTNSITFNPFKLTQSAAPTLSGSAAFSPPFSSKLSNLSSSFLNKPFNPLFVSKPSNPDNQFSRSVFSQSSQKQDNQVFHLDSSSTMVSSPLHKFRPKNQDICASGHSMSTNDFTLPCSVPYTLSIQVPSSPMASTLNKNTSTVPETISTTQSFPSPVFSSIHRLLPHVEELASSPQSQQCTTTTIPFTSFHRTSGLFSLDLQKGWYENQNDQQCNQEYDMEKELDMQKGSYENQNEQQCINQHDAEELISFTNAMFPSHPSFIPHEEELFSVLQSEQCSKSTDCVTSQSTTGVSNLNTQQGLYENQKEQHDMEKELTSTKLPGFELYAGSQLYENQCTTDLSNLNTQQGLHENQKHQITRKNDMEKELMSTKLPGFGLSADSQLFENLCTSDLSNLNMHQGLSEMELGFEWPTDSQLRFPPQSQQCNADIHCTDMELQDEIELSSEELVDFEEWFT